MGYGNYSDLKAQYYPTDSRICNFFTYLHFDIKHEDEVEYLRYAYDRNNPSCKKIKEYTEYMQTKVYKFKKDWHKIPSYSQYYFQKDIIEGNESNINKYGFAGKSNYYSDGDSYQICCADFFAGQGEWLRNYAKYPPKGYNPSNPFYSIKTLAVELVKERYEKCVKNKIDYAYNCSYEDFSFAKETVSLLLFNPPYATNGGERLTKMYLKDIIEKRYLCSKTAMVDFVIRIDDFKDCLDILLDHFEIIESTMFKAPSDEYDKFKQVIFTARYKYHYALPRNTAWDVRNRQEKKEGLLEKLSNVTSIDVTNLTSDTLNETRDIARVKLEEQISLIKLQSNNKDKISELGDDTWKWFKDITEIKTDTVGDLIIPKLLKQGEKINLIASGKIQGKVGNHVVCGGTEQVTQTSTSIKISDDGKEFEETEVKKINQPYFNVLMPSGEIKKLLNIDTMANLEDEGEF